MKKQYTKKQIQEAIAYWKNKLNESSIEYSEADMFFPSIDVFDSLNSAKCNLYLNAQDDSKAKELADAVQDIIDSDLVEDGPRLGECKLKPEFEKILEPRLREITRKIQSICSFGILDINIEDGRLIINIFCDNSQRPYAFGRNYR